MHYIPSDYLNNQWSYYYNNNYFIVRTNNNCYTNYNSQYCDCYNIFQNNDYLISNAYSCSTPNNQYSINYASLTDNYNYRVDIVNSYVIFLIFFIMAFYLPYKIISRLFGRWLKV